MQLLRIIFSNTHIFFLVNIILKGDNSVIPTYFFQMKINLLSDEYCYQVIFFENDDEN